MPNKEVHQGTTHNDNKNNENTKPRVNHSNGGGHHNNNPTRYSQDRHKNSAINKNRTYYGPRKHHGHIPPPSPNGFIGIEHPQIYSPAANHSPQPNLPHNGPWGFSTQKYDPARSGLMGPPYQQQPSIPRLSPQPPQGEQSSVAGPDDHDQFGGMDPFVMQDNKYLQNHYHVNGDNSGSMFINSGQMRGTWSPLQHFHSPPSMDSPFYQSQVDATSNTMGMNTEQKYPSHGHYTANTAQPLFEEPDAETIMIENIRYQTEYYFKTGNLVHDLYLRKQADSQGYVPMSLLVEFNRLKSYNTTPELLRKACTVSQELQYFQDENGIDKMRGKDSEYWARQPLPFPSLSPFSRSSLSGGAAPFFPKSQKQSQEPPLIKPNRNKDSTPLFIQSLSVQSHDGYPVEIKRDEDSRDKAIDSVIDQLQIHVTEVQLQRVEISTAAMMSNGQTGQPELATSFARDETVDNHKAPETSQNRSNNKENLEFSGNGIPSDAENDENDRVEDNTTKITSKPTLMWAQVRTQTPTYLMNICANHVRLQQNLLPLEESPLRYQERGLGNDLPWPSSQERRVLENN